MSTLSMEGIIRPFVDVTSLPNAIVRTPPAFVKPAAFISWGRPSQFNAKDFRSQAANPISFVGPEDPEPDKRPRFNYTVQGAASDEITYYKSDDLDCYVTVHQARSWSIVGPHGAHASFHLLAAKEPGDGGESGQEPEEPPELGELHERPEWIEWNHRHSGAFDIP